jgi:hypothetical protein
MRILLFAEDRAFCGMARQICLATYSPLSTGRFAMTISIGHLSPVLALLAGILILLIPRLLNYIVAIYLIAIGIIGLGIFR